MSTALWSQLLKPPPRRPRISTTQLSHTKSAPPDTSNDEAFARALHSLLNYDTENGTTSANRPYPAAPLGRGTGTSSSTTAGWHSGQSPCPFSHPTSSWPSQSFNRSANWLMTEISPSGITYHDALPDYLFQGNEATQVLEAISRSDVSSTDLLRDTAVESSSGLVSTPKSWGETDPEAGPSISPSWPSQFSSKPDWKRVRRKL